MRRAALWALMLCACTRKPGAEEAAAEPKAVRCEVAVVGEVDDVVKLRGTIAPLPDRDAQVAPQVAGRIVAILAREGDVVAAGQLVARIDDGPLLDDAKAAEAALTRTKAEHRNTERTLERLKKVFEHGIAARQEVDDAMARDESAAAGEAEAEATFERARRLVERASVKSPLNGVVVKLIRKPGELVDGTPATPVLEIADPSRLELVADTAVPDLVRLHVGDAATVTVPALSSASWSGAVAAVSPAVDRATGLGVARVSLVLGDADSGTLRPPIGTLGTAQVRVGQVTGVLVPAQALRASSGDQAEVVVCGPKARVRLVHRTVVGGDKVAIDNVDAGEAVAVEPVLGIADGDALVPPEGEK